MDFNTLITNIQDWFLSASSAVTKSTSDFRTWANLGFDKEFTQKDIHTYFDRSTYNNQYADILKVTSAPVADGRTKKAYPYIEAENNLIYSAHKSFVARKKSRIAYYKDDLVNKTHRNMQSASIASATYDDYKQDQQDYSS